MDADQLAADEQQTKEELLFALHHRDKPTLAFVECKSTAKRDELEDFLRQELTEYTFYTVDLTPLAVASLLRTLDEHLPASVKDAPPVTYVVNVHGLENRLDEQLAAQLNLERELLFRNVPYITLIWADAYFFRKLQRLAPDLWHWVTYKFRFDDPAVQPLEALPPLPPEPLPQKGDIEARRERIHSLEERYSHLDLDTSNKLRLLRDKLTIKSLLGAEYAEAFEFPKAIAVYREALGLDEQIQAAVARENGEPQNMYQRGALLYELGAVYLDSGLFHEALSTYQQSKKLLPEDTQGNIEHQMGMVYAEQKQWAQALKRYKRAIDLNKRAGKTFELCDTYHQIGMAYAEQEKWMPALNNYKQAITLRKQTGNTSHMGSTYHEIGTVYIKQSQWVSAIKNYEQALVWKQQANRTFELASTYHQLGVMYAKQKKWIAALEHYKKASMWMEQTGNTFGLAGTYYQIGLLHEELGELTEALGWFKKAIAIVVYHPNLPMAERSLARVQEKLRHPPTP